MTIVNLLVGIYALIFAGIVIWTRFHPEAVRERNRFSSFLFYAFTFYWLLGLALFLFPQLESIQPHLSRIFFAALTWEAFQWTDSILHEEWDPTLTPKDNRKLNLVSHGIGLAADAPAYIVTFLAVKPDAGPRTYAFCALAVGLGIGLASLLRKKRNQDSRSAQRAIDP